MNKHSALCKLRLLLSACFCPRSMLRPLVLALALLSTGARAECDINDFPVLPEMRISALMDSGSYNDHAMAVRGFSAEVLPGSVAGFYKRMWKDRYSESLMDPWQQISTLEGSCFYTVQYADLNGGSFGRLVLSRLPDEGVGGSENLGQGVIKPSDSIVVSDMRTRDGRKKGRVTIITSGRSVSDLMGFYRREMAFKGWALDQSFSESGHGALMFRQRGNEINVLMTPTPDATQILINEVIN